MASIYSPSTDTHHPGLQGSRVCDAAIVAARAMARQQGADVVLYDDDGVWRVGPTGPAVEMDAADLAAMGLSDD